MEPSVTSGEGQYGILLTFQKLSGVLPHSNISQQRRTASSGNANDYETSVDSARGGLGQRKPEPHRKLRRSYG